MIEDRHKRNKNMDKVMVKKKKISKKLDKYFQNKKKLTITLTTAVVVTVLLIGTSFIYYSVTSTSSKNQTIAESDKPAADHLKEMAAQAVTDQKYTQAKALYETAMKQYQYIVDNTTDTAIHDTAKNAVIDCSAQIWLIEHTLTQQ
jgi:ElaB/YqjD/DUF883 family membrane-anchored ribosome-binding protein